MRLVRLLQTRKRSAQRIAIARRFRAAVALAYPAMGTDCGLLEEAELTDGQGHALSAHKSQQAYEGYAKRTLKRALAATRNPHAHTQAHAAKTNIQNERQNHIQTAGHEKSKKARNWLGRDAKFWLMMQSAAN